MGARSSAAGPACLAMICMVAPVCEAFAGFAKPSFAKPSKANMITIARRQAVTLFGTRSALSRAPPKERREGTARSAMQHASLAPVCMLDMPTRVPACICASRPAHVPHVGPQNVDLTWAS